MRRSRANMETEQNRQTNRQKTAPERRVGGGGGGERERERERESDRPWEITPLYAASGLKVEGSVGTARGGGVTVMLAIDY